MNILILDDERRICDEVSEYLLRRKHRVFISHTPSKAFKVIGKQQIDLLILDIRLPEMDGIEVLKKVKEQSPETEVIMISGHGDMETVIEAMRYGAVDFLQKPFKHIDIQLALERILKFVNQKEKIKFFRSKSDSIQREYSKNIDSEFIGNSKSVIEIKNKIKRAANFDVNVLIIGESGTGKEIVTRMIHNQSNRKVNNLCSVNCAAIPETLLESEFFGHKKGAFTGANSDKDGLFELADKGTLFLDEIADMPLNLQTKLLRAIEENKFKKLGGNKEVNTDVRVISATNKNIEDLVAEKKFRLDLFYRLNTLIIELPSLRERKSDIRELADFFIEKFTSQSNIAKPNVDESFYTKLESYDFPGNVRELKNIIERAIILSDSKILDDSILSLNNQKHQLEFVRKTYNLEEAEKELIEEVLQRTGGHQTQSAGILGISRHALIRKMKKHNI
ncbi:MAG: sigma-54 dependent transcriptional regulator [Candidatus Cloacimonadota bacterium]|nr:sigma-54 dependent transcriptional regulator [Candidatus Cloacimonadota bacterium]